jgi:hypothetical protein
MEETLWRNISMETRKDALKAIYKPQRISHLESPQNKNSTNSFKDYLDPW